MKKLLGAVGFYLFMGIGFVFMSIADPILDRYAEAMKDLRKD